MRSTATIEVKKEMTPRSVDKCNFSAVLVALGLELAVLLVVPIPPPPPPVLIPPLPPVVVAVVVDPLELDAPSIPP